MRLADLADKKWKTQAEFANVDDPLDAVVQLPELPAGREFEVFVRDDPIHQLLSDRVRIGGEVLVVLDGRLPLPFDLVHSSGWS